MLMQNFRFYFQEVYLSFPEFYTILNFPREIEYLARCFNWMRPSPLES